MKKFEQENINIAVDEYFYSYSNDNALPIDAKRLRTCNAVVFEYDEYYALRSYNTVVALIDKKTHIMYDGLRFVYGYTATSCQHIAKFAKDYGATYTMRYYPI